MLTTHLLKKILPEAVVLYIAPIIFLAIYVFYFLKPLSAGLIHLYQLTLIFSALTIVRVITNTTSKPTKLIATSLSLLYALIVVTLLFYYTLVLIGLKTWRRVITEELIFFYAGQAQDFCAAIGMQYSLIILFILFTYLIAWRCFYLFIKNRTIKLTFEDTSLKLQLLLLITLLLACLHLLQSSLADTPIKSLEPFAITMKAGKKGQVNHNSWQGVVVNDELNKAEENETHNYHSSPDPDKKNVIIIVVDALRPDHMGIYGYHRNTTPHLSQLMQSNNNLSIIQNGRASCSESSCGLMSLASSRYVHQLPSNPLTLQKVLKKYGYSTTMILGGDHTNFYGLREAYGPIDNYFDGSMAKGYYANDDSILLNKLSSLPRWDKTPTMIQLHLMSAHVLGKRLPQFEKFKPVKKYNGTTRGPTQEEYLNFYDNGVLQADAFINNILNELKAKNYLENSLVVITADHGEELGEYGSYAHAANLREKSLGIPLVFISYGPSKLDIIQARKLISQVDIAPTILKHLHMRIPATWSGEPINENKKNEYIYFMLAPEVGLYDLSLNNKLYKFIYNLKTGVQTTHELNAIDSNNANTHFKMPDSQKQKWIDALSTIKIEEN